MARGGEGVPEGPKVRRDLLLALLALTAPVIPTPKQSAIDTVLGAARIAAAQREPWWAWSVWHSAGISIRRIEAM